MLGHTVLLRPIYFNMGQKSAKNNKREGEKEAEREKAFRSQRVWGNKKRLASGCSLITKEKKAETEVAPLDMEEDSLKDYLTFMRREFIICKK